MQCIKNKSVLYGIFFMLILVCLFQYGIQKIYGIIIYPDEFGYWASAANWLGYDWSELASMGSYYSYGYSLILTPLLGLFDEGIAAYRAAVAVNMTLMCLSIWLLFGSLRKLFVNLNETVLMFCAGTGVFYPAWIFYMQMTLTEALLMFLYVVIFFLFLRFAEKPGVMTSIGLACSIVYLYFVHMRTVGVVIACILAMLFLMMIKPECRKAGSAFFLCLIVLGVLGSGMKNLVISRVYAQADTEALAVNDYSGQWEKFREILTPKGLIKLLAGCICKLFYLGMSTFGLFYGGMACLIKKVRDLFLKIQRKERAELSETASLYLLLSVAGQFLITAIYTYRADRIDIMLYGRYNEIFLPLLMSIGLAAMWQAKRIFLWNGIFCLASGFVVPLILEWIRTEEMTSFHPYFTVGITYLYEEAGFSPSSFFWQAYLLGSVFMLMAAAFIRIGRKNKKNNFLMMGILIMEIFLGIVISEKFTYRYQRVVADDKKICDFISEREEKEAGIFYLYEGGNMYIDSLQLLMPEKVIHFIQEKDRKNISISSKDYLVLDIQSSYREEMEKNYELLEETASFLLFTKAD